MKVYDLLKIGLGEGNQVARPLKLKTLNAHLIHKIQHGVFIITFPPEKE